MNKVNNELREQAIKLGMCEQWKTEWEEDWTPDEMAEKLFKGINFCADKHFPSMDMLIRNFDREWLRSKNILADDTYSLLNPEHAFIIGSSSSHIRFNGISSGVLHIQGSSKVFLSVKNRSKVIVHLWDKTELEVTKELLSRLLVVRHSSDTLVSSKDSFTIRNKY